MNSELGMTKIHIADTTKCMQAVEWCVENVPSKLWKMDAQWPATGYDFVFNDPKAATLFSLKWAGNI